VEPGANSGSGSRWRANRVARISREDQDIIRSYLEGGKHGYDTICSWVEQATHYYRGSYSKIDFTNIEGQTFHAVLVAFREKRFTGDGSLKGYVWGAFENLVLSAERKRKNEEQKLATHGHELKPADPSVDPLVGLIAREENAQFFRIMSNLGHRSKKLLIYRHRWDLSYKEIGLKLGISESAAKKRHFDCVKRLRRIRKESEKR